MLLSDSIGLILSNDCVSVVGFAFDDVCISSFEAMGGASTFVIASILDST